MEDHQLGESVSSQNSVRFGPYLLDRRTGELRKHGIRIKLSGQPLEVLLLLLERPGELVTREELRRRLWTNDVFVDFERSLNSAVKKLRRALNDDPQQPCYIETYPRKGYRFIGVIEQEPVPTSHPAASDASGNNRSRDHLALSAALLPEGSHAENGVTAIPAPNRWKSWMAISLVLIVAAMVFFTTTKSSRNARTSGTGAQPQKNLNLRSSIAVLGFKNLSSHKDIDWLSTAITQMLSTELAGGDKTRIIPEEIVARAKQNLDSKKKIATRATLYATCARGWAATTWSLALTWPSAIRIADRFGWIFACKKRFREKR